MVSQTHTANQFRERLIDLFCSPERSLRSIADELGITLDALTLLIARADIIECLTSLTCVSAFRTRLIAASHLPNVIPALAATLAAAKLEEANFPVDFTDPASIERAQRRQEGTRKASSLLVRLARFAALPLNHISRAGTPASASTGAPEHPAPAVSTPPAPVTPTNIPSPSPTASIPTASTPSTSRSPGPTPPLSSSTNAAAAPRYISARRKKQFERRLADLNPTLPRPAS